MLLVHIASAGAWIGMDIVLGVLVFTALFSDSGATKALSYQALELFAIWPLFATGLICLLSGIVLSLGTKYGLVKFWWVAVKLVLNVVLSSLVLFALRPGVLAAAEQGRDYLAGGAVPSMPDLIFPPIVSTMALLFAFVLSVYKPWGRIRRNPARPTRTAQSLRATGAEPTSRTKADAVAA